MWGDYQSQYLVKYGVSMNYTKDMASYPGNACFNRASNLQSTVSLILRIYSRYCFYHQIITFWPTIRQLIRSRTVPVDTPESDHDSRSWIHKHPILRHMYTKDGVFLPVGSTLTRPKFASTLEVIAECGADAFYEGQISTRYSRCCCC